MNSHRNTGKGPVEVLKELLREDFLDALRATFPNRLPPPMTDPRETDMRVGEQRVIALLERLLRERTSPTPKRDPHV